MNLKDTVVEIASSIGFHRTVIGSLEAMPEAREQFDGWLSKGYAAQMDYLKRNPHFRTSPALLFPQARSAIIVSVSYFTDVPESPGPFFGKVARYAVGLDYHAVIRRKLRELKASLEDRLGRKLWGKAATDDVALFEQAYAVKHGLGFAGKNTMVLGPRLSGSYNFVAELFTDLEIEPDEPYLGTCGKCFRCGIACPTGAIQPVQTLAGAQVRTLDGTQGSAKDREQEGIQAVLPVSAQGGRPVAVENGSVDSNLCISYLTIENKGEIPVELRSKLGRWVFGCDICQEVCPYNRRPPEAPWPEFSPEMGAGHHLDLLKLLNMTEEEFQRDFQASPLRRPRLKGLTRNALVVLGNCLSDAPLSEDRESEAAVKAVFTFATNTSDPLLREHALWCLAQHKDKRTRDLVHRLAHREKDPANRRKMNEYVESRLP